MRTRERPESMGGWDLMRGYRLGLEGEPLPARASKDMKRGWQVGRVKRKAMLAHKRAADAAFRARRDAQRAAASPQQEHQA